MKLLPFLFLLAFIFPASARTCHTEHQFLAPDITHCSKAHRHHHVHRKPPAFDERASLKKELKSCAEEWEKWGKR